MDRDFHGVLLSAEAGLSPFAQRSDQSLGRMKKMEKDPFRLDFARDETRILHSTPFRRLKHKTQVFISPHNDHICTRMEHVLHVSSVAMVMGRCLGLNIDLISAIAKGHDLGHAPFGHVGERALNEALRAHHIKRAFMHEVHSLRVVDFLTHHGHGLNLTCEVRDGILSHNGEKFEQEIKPDRGKDLSKLHEIRDRSHRPATLEGCLVRMADKVAYLGRDLEDAIDAKLVDRGDLPESIRKGLGDSNGQIIGKLVEDIVLSSMGQDGVRLSREAFELMLKLKDFNYQHIYKVQPQMEKVGQIIRKLFEEFLEILALTKRGKKEREKWVGLAPSLRIFFDFLKNVNYTDETEDAMIVLDYVSGMTDNFATLSFSELFMPRSMV